MLEAGRQPRDIPDPYRTATLVLDAVCTISFRSLVSGNATFSFKFRRTPEGDATTRNAHGEGGQKRGEKIPQSRQETSLAKTFNGWVHSIR